MFYIDSAMKPNHEFAQEAIDRAMERGVRVDTEKVKQLCDRFNKQANAMKLELQGEYNISNPNSSVQVKNAFLRVIREDDLHHCKVMGKVTFKKEVLAKLSELGYELADMMIAYRAAKKTVENLQTLLDFSDSNGLIHPLVDRGITNRFNYSKPALMNIPKSLLWDAIIPYEENHSLYSVDIKQQEPWIIVNMLGIQELKDLLAKHKDFYKALYFAAFHTECSDEQRKEVKRAWNAMSYGASEQGILQYCTTFDGHTLYKYFNSIKEYKQYKGRAIGLSKKGVHVSSTYFDTKLYADEYGGKLQRMLMNIPIQGTGSDILAFLIERFYNEIEEYGYEDLMSLYYTRHDELIIEVSDRVTEDSCKEQLNSIFQHQIDDWEPFQVEICKVSANTNVDGYDLDD